MTLQYGKYLHRDLCVQQLAIGIGQSYEGQQVVG